MLHVLTTQTLIFIYPLYPFCAAYPLPSGNYYSGLMYEFFWFSMYWIFKDRIQYQITQWKKDAIDTQIIHIIIYASHYYMLVYILIYTS